MAPLPPPPPSTKPLPNPKLPLSEKAKLEVVKAEDPSATLREAHRLTVRKYRKVFKWALFTILLLVMVLRRFGPVKNSKSPSQGRSNLPIEILPVTRKAPLARAPEAPLRGSVRDARGC